ncbi:hypothetical protein MKW92_044761 [Papaver armeniacum]|nr:hypothetical protein MKW92_044761 [Papaver armeniacum]
MIMTGEVQVAFHLLSVTFLFLLITRFSVISNGCQDKDRIALLTFKSSLEDPSNRLSSWKIEGRHQNCCTWHGIQCSGDSSHVISIDLRNIEGESLFSQNQDPQNTSLSGKLSTSIFNITHLEYLDLSFNDFQFSTIPHGFSNLKKLTHLDLGSSNFLDSITTQFENMSSLQYLDISCDYASLLTSSSINWVRDLTNLKVLNLRGFDLYESASTQKNFVKSISSLSNLRHLELSRCNISRPLFLMHEFFHLTRLTSLRMSENNLHLQFPILHANLTSSLSILNLSYCGLQGTPGHLPYLPKLKELDVSSNPDLNVNLSLLFEHQLPQLQTLAISETKLNGSIPSSIINAPVLTSLTASDCSIKQLPSSIFNLSRLRYLDLSANSITGYLPGSLSNLKNLQFLSLSYNNFQGPIPELICEISTLQVLDLAYNNFTGTIPSCVKKFRNLNRFDVYGNSLEGNVSVLSLINELNLNSLHLSPNRLTAVIDEQQHLSKFKLDKLGLRSCNLRGLIPAFICDLTQLSTLDLSNNKLSGAIPSCLFKLKNLSYLDLSQNQLQTTLPHFHFMKSEWETSLNLSYNNFHGPIPLPPQRATFVDLSHNNFSGDISIEVGKLLSTVAYVSLSSNALFGSIPYSLCPKVNMFDFGLTSLDLSNNNLSGVIPCSIKYCGALRSLNLGGNNLTGNIPKELEQAVFLSYLQLNDNGFTGSFPRFVKKLSLLRVLNLGSNNFEGRIPSFIGTLKELQILSLRSNKFNGSIPEEIGFLHNLQILDLSINNLSGPVPKKIGKLKNLRRRPTTDAYSLEDFGIDLQLQMVVKGIMTQFEQLYTYSSGIDLSCNILDGNIPKEIGLLKGLAMLNLSYNHFSGNITASIGNMTGLGSLDLSFNKLSGEIPESLTSIDHLGYLNLSYNNLSGRIPRGAHFDTLSVDGSAYINNSLLCGFPTQNLCNGDSTNTTDTNAPNAVQEDDNTDDAKEQLFLYAAIILGVAVGFWGPFFLLLLRKEKWWVGYWRVVEIVATRITNRFRKI